MRMWNARITAAGRSATSPDMKREGDEREGDCVLDEDGIRRPGQDPWRIPTEQPKSFGGRSKPCGLQGGTGLTAYLTIYTLYSAVTGAKRYWRRCSRP
eukprot:3560786-Pyramimonas_sp.AAC.1